MNDASPDPTSAIKVSPVLSHTLNADAVIASRDDQPQLLTAAALVDLECPEDVRISASGKHAVYCLRPATKTGEYETASLWIADVGKERSARQLTSGLFKDESPQWSPDGTTIAFISDRAKHGQSSAIYLLPLESSEPFSITDYRNKKKISSFKWSPNGRFIAFISPDEDTVDERSRTARKDDVVVYGAKWDYNRLRCVHLETRSTLTLFNKTAHVNEFIWNAQSDQLVYVLQRTPGFMDPALIHGVSFGKISLKRKTEICLCIFLGPVSHLTWFGEYLYFLGGVSPNKSNSAGMIYRVQQDGQGLAPFAFGADDCAKELRWATGFLAVQVQKGPQDQILLLFGSSTTVLYGDTYEITTWDILDLGDGKVSLLIGRGSPSNPTEIYVIQDQNIQQLSYHGDAIAKLNVTDAEIFYAAASDNTELDGVLLIPKRADEKPWPTIVLPHGGPLTRVTCAFDVPLYHWGPWLAAAGYAVLCPNYRGGSSRGENFASQVRGAIGTKDYSDIIDMVNSGIKRGIFNPNRIAIGGWSLGGFLSYLSVTRRDFHFRAAVCGGGITDWDTLNMSSDVYSTGAELAGGAPWTMEPDNVETRRSSAVWHMKEIKTPILILHSERDERVPLSQATAFHHGCLYHNIPCEMVTYPREPHVVAERLHRIDMLNRIKRFYDLHLQ